MAAIDALLHDPALRTRGLTGERKDAPPGPIVSRDLVAELLTERAAILEDGAGAALAQASQDFTTAARMRPRMKFAQRGHLRCLIREGKFERAEEREGIIRRELGRPLPPDVLVDFGRLAVARASASDQPAEAKRHYTEAIRCYEEALSENPDYGPAYGARLAAVRMSGSPEELGAEDRGGCGCARRQPAPAGSSGWSSGGRTWPSARWTPLSRPSGGACRTPARRRWTMPGPASSTRIAWIEGWPTPAEPRTPR